MAGRVEQEALRAGVGMDERDRQPVFRRPAVVTTSRVPEFQPPASGVTVSARYGQAASAAVMSSAAVAGDMTTTVEQAGRGYARTWPSALPHRPGPAGLRDPIRRGQAT